MNNYKQVRMKKKTIQKLDTENVNCSFLTFYTLYTYMEDFLELQKKDKENYT